MIKIGGTIDKRLDDKLKSDIKKEGYPFPLPVDFIATDRRVTMTTKRKEQILTPGGRNVSFRGVDEKGREVIYYKKEREVKNGENYYEPSLYHLRNKTAINDIQQAHFMIFYAIGVQGNKVDLRDNRDPQVKAKGYQIRILNIDKDKAAKGRLRLERNKLRRLIEVDESDLDKKLEALKLAAILNIVDPEKRDFMAVMEEISEMIDNMDDSEIKRLSNLLIDPRYTKASTLVSKSQSYGLIIKSNENGKIVWSTLDEMGIKDSTLHGGILTNSDPIESLIQEIMGDSELENILSKMVVAHEAVKGTN